MQIIRHAVVNPEFRWEEVIQISDGMNINALARFLRAVEGLPEDTPGRGRACSFVQNELCTGQIVSLLSLGRRDSDTPFTPEQAQIVMKAIADPEFHWHDILEGNLCLISFDGLERFISNIKALPGDIAQRETVLSYLQQQLMKKTRPSKVQRT